MRDVHGAPRQLRQRDIAFDHDRLGRRRDAFQAEQRRVRPFVRDAIPLQGGIFAVVDDRHAEHARVLERAAHQERGRHRTPVVGHRHAAGGVQLTDIGHLLAPRSARDGADRVHARDPRLGRPAQDQLRDARLVVDRIRVRHAGDGGKAARHRGGTPVATVSLCS